MTHEENKETMSTTTSILTVLKRTS